MSDERMSDERMSIEQAQRVQQLLDEAGKLLEEARVLSAGLENNYFYFDKLGYGAGATLENGEWLSSSNTC